MQETGEKVVLWIYPWLLLRGILFFEQCCWKVGKMNGSKTKAYTSRKLANSQSHYFIHLFDLVFS